MISYYSEKEIFNDFSRDFMISVSSENPQFLQYIRVTYEQVWNLEHLSSGIL